MKLRIFWGLAICSIPAFFGMASGAEPPRETGKTPAAGATATKSTRSLDDARREAAQLHSALHATLQIVHHQYYREDEGLPLPAASLKDVFAEMEESHGIKLRWLAVEGQAMNTDHKPRGSFETAAVEALERLPN